MSGRGKQLAEEHWNGYVGPLLVAHGCSEEIIRIVQFHYISSGIHFYKHAVEDIRHGEAGRKTMPPPPDPWDKCKCGEVVAECKCADPVTHLDRNFKVGGPCDKCTERDTCPRPEGTVGCTGHIPHGG